MLDNAFINSIFKIQTSAQFLSKALEVFQYQYQHNAIYKQFIDHLGVNHKQVRNLEEIPFLPISFFKAHKVVSFQSDSELVFTSSATTSDNVSKHYVKDAKIYRQAFNLGFELFYGSLSEYVVIGLLPSYLDRKGSSLIYMVQDFIEQSKSKVSGFHKHIDDNLLFKMKQLNASNQKVLLVGVSYALMDLADRLDEQLGDHFTVIETGGMKGQRAELSKQELHAYLQKGLGVKQVHSEYGMTELLSQSYASNYKNFVSAPWKKVLVRDLQDPMCYLQNKLGAINIIDLANVYSCSFIATDDLGMLNEDDSFELFGRLNNADVRGCNLMYEG